MMAVELHLKAARQLRKLRIETDVMKNYADGTKYLSAFGKQKRH